MHTTALAPCSMACCNISSNASSRVFSHRLVRIVMLPPTIVCNAAPRFPSTLRERTIIPRTTPKFLTMRYPGSSRAEVTMLASTLGMLSLLLAAFTGAILSTDKPYLQQSYFATLNAHGESVLFSGPPADRGRRLPDLAGHPMAGLRATAYVHGPGLLRATHRSAVSVQGCRAGTGTQSCGADRI